MKIPLVVEYIWLHRFFWLCSYSIFCQYTKRKKTWINSNFCSKARYENSKAQFFLPAIKRTNTNTWNRFVFVCCVVYVHVSWFYPHIFKQSFKLCFFCLKEKKRSIKWWNCSIQRWNKNKKETKKENKIKMYEVEKRKRKESKCESFLRSIK